MLNLFIGLPYSSVGEETVCNAGDPGFIPGTGRSPGEGNINPLQYSCLENLMDQRAWQATVCRVTGVRHNGATKAPPTSPSPNPASPVSLKVFLNKPHACKSHKCSLLSE